MLQKDPIFPNIMKEKRIQYFTVSLCCVQLSGQTHSHTLAPLWLSTALSNVYSSLWLHGFLSLCFQPERLPQPAAVAVERSLRNITNWVSSSVQSSQESYRAFPSSSTLLTNTCSSIYPTLMSLSGFYSCLLYQYMSCVHNISLWQFTEHVLRFKTYMGRWVMSNVWWVMSNVWLRV